MNVSAIKNKTILIVDKDVELLTMREGYLKTAGAKVLRAENRKQAMDLFNQFPVDLVITDLMMDYMDDGFVLCHEIRKIKPNTPIVIVSAVTGQTGFAFDTTTEEERSWIKADVMLNKPVRIEQMLGEVDRLLKD